MDVKRGELELTLDKSSESSGGGEEGKESRIGRAQER